MNSLSILVLLICTNIVLCDDPRCDKPHQVYHDPVTEKVCTDGCEAGCYCKVGYKVTDDGDCVPGDPKDCNYKHMRYQCGSYICEEWCSTLQDPICSYAKFDCDNKCLCKPGYIWQGSIDRCISIETCHYDYFHRIG